MAGEVGADGANPVPVGSVEQRHPAARCWVSRLPSAQYSTNTGPASPTDPSAAAVARSWVSRLMSK